MEDWQNSAIGDRIEELVRMPCRSQRPGFGFAIANDTGDDEIGIIKDSTKGMAERITKFAPFMNRARALRRGMAGNTARKRKLKKKLPQPGLILADIGVDFTVSTLQIRITDHRRTAVPR